MPEFFLIFEGIQVLPMLSTGALSPSHQSISCGRAQRGNQTSFCFACPCGFVVTQITSHVSTPLGMQGSSKPFWEITHPLGFPAQFPSLSPESKCTLGFFLEGPYGMRQEGVLRKKTLWTTYMWPWSVLFPLSKVKGVLQPCYWLAGGWCATQLVPTGFQTALEHSKFPSTALVLQVTVFQDRTLAQSTLIPVGLVESLH